jgi:hypothetical protein
VKDIVISVFADLIYLAGSYSRLAYAIKYELFEGNEIATDLRSSQ